MSAARRGFASDEEVAEFERTDSWEVQGDELVLIGCSASKHSVAAPARDLYTGELFRAAVAWAESWRLRWAVLSALHGVVFPDSVIEPYNHVLGPRDVDIRRLAQLVTWQVASADLDPAPSGVIVLAGERYAETVRRAQQLGRAANGPSVWRRGDVWFPLQELPRRGVGYYRQWLRQNTAGPADLVEAVTHG